MIEKFIEIHQDFFHQNNQIIMLNSSYTAAYSILALDFNPKAGDINMKIHNNAIEYLKKIKNQDNNPNKALRIRQKGCSWHATWEIVLDEQKTNDLVYYDKGIKIIADKALSHRICCATIECVKTIRGYYIRLR